MQKSARKRRRLENELEAQKSGRAYGSNRKPFEEPLLVTKRKKGVTLGKLQQIWPTFK